MPRSELGDFLRSRRAAVTPAQAGLPDTGRRRVPGLRREEIARLIGVSTDYYVRLEQGRGGRPSRSVIGSIARVLELSRAERAHLTDLAQAPDPAIVRPRRPPIPVPSPDLQRLVEQFEVPAMIITRCVQVVGWNPLCARLLAPFDELDVRERNIARLLFEDTDLAARHRDWDLAVRDVVGILRMTAGQEPDNVLLQELVGELAVGSPTFGRLWAEHNVHEKTSGPKPFRHPEVGDLDLHYETFVVATDPSLMVVSYTAEPGSKSADGLELLRELVATDRAALTEA